MAPSDGCPSRHSPATVVVRRQPALRGSDRAYRGALLKRLSRASGHRLPELSVRSELASGHFAIGPTLDDDGWERILAGLERDGLVHRREGDLSLGAATIRR